MLSPKKRYKTKVINILLSGNAGGENKRNIIIKNTLYEAYDINKILLSKKHYKRKL